MEIPGVDGVEAVAGVDGVDAFADVESVVVLLPLLVGVQRGGAVHRPLPPGAWLGGDRGAAFGVSIA